MFHNKDVIISLKICRVKRYVVNIPQCLVPQVGIELTTYRLQGECSTDELQGQNLERVPRIELGNKPWQGFRLPLHHTRNITYYISKTISWQQPFRNYFRYIWCEHPDSNRDAEAADFKSAMYYQFHHARIWSGVKESNPY